GQEEQEEIFLVRGAEGESTRGLRQKTSREPHPGATGKLRLCTPRRDKTPRPSALAPDFIAYSGSGKHVCVEYPMALSYQAAVQLWDLAQKKGVVLHEEHIELLTEDYKQLKKEVEGKTLLEGSLHFAGGALKPGFGFLAFSGIARLSWLADLFGELSVSAATFEEDAEQGYSKMTAQLLTSDSKPLTWIEERQAGLPRTKKINFVFDGFTLTQIPPAPRGTVGLFMQDLIYFSAKLSGQVSTEELDRERVRILHCLGLAQKIQDLSCSNKS
uniref:Uncharacterized protein n=1 Tax=Xiphophorus couchianus TaxID=32473 RepID=A0A3B5LEY3_9TELE